MILEDLSHYLGYFKNELSNYNTIPHYDTIQKHIQIIEQLLDTAYMEMKQNYNIDVENIRRQLSIINNVKVIGDVNEPNYITITKQYEDMIYHINFDYNDGVMEITDAYLMLMPKNPPNIIRNYISINRCIKAKYLGKHLTIPEVCQSIIDIDDNVVQAKIKKYKGESNDTVDSDADDDEDLGVLKPKKRRNTHLPSRNKMQSILKSRQIRKPKSKIDL